MITAAAGGVGLSTIQLISRYRNSLPEEYASQLRIIAVCSSKNFEYVKAHGATHFIDYRTQDVVQECRNITEGFGVDVWVDHLGNDSVA